MRKPIEIKVILFLALCQIFVQAEVLCGQWNSDPACYRYQTGDTVRTWIDTSYYCVCNAPASLVYVPVRVSGFDSINTISLSMLVKASALSYYGLQYVHPAITLPICGFVLSSGYALFRFAGYNYDEFFDISDDDTLIVIKFLPLCDTTRLIWETWVPGACQYSYDLDIRPAIFIDGNVLEGQGTIEGTLQYDNILQTPVSGARIILTQNGMAMDSVISEPSGFFHFSHVPAGNYTITGTAGLPWGGGNATDALIVLKHFTGMDTLTGIRLMAADVNNSGSINSVDALMIVQRFVGVISSFPAGDWVFTEETLTVTPCSLNIIPLTTLCTGDLNASHSP